MSFTCAGLSDELCRAADESGYKDLFPVQKKGIPLILEGKNIAAAAQTGSGKTAAFLLPLLQRFFNKLSGNRTIIKVLVLVPTRELAAQVADAGVSLSIYLPFKPGILAVYGGVSINSQMISLKKNADILIATPGRLMDLVRRNAADLSGVEVLVMDEADRMLDLGFREEIISILKVLPLKRQNLLFSATLDSRIEIPGMDFLKDAVKIEIDQPDNPGEMIEQIVYRVNQDEKGLFLRFLINSGSLQQVLVFVSSRRRAENVVRKLNNNSIHAEALHGDKSQGARAGALERFKKGKVRVLVATDLASRGLDIKELTHVINYELPRSAVDYIHRIGRTGRAGMKGTAVTLLAEDEYLHMKLIEKRMGRKPVYADAAAFEYR